MKGTIPDGWLALPASQFRLLNYRFGESGMGEVWVSISSGTVLDNANRWLKQFGAAPLDQAGLEKLRAVPVAGATGPMGYKLEAPPIHPILAAITLPNHGRGHARWMNELPRMQVLLALLLKVLPVLVLEVLPVLLLKVLPVLLKVLPVLLLEVLLLLE